MGRLALIGFCWAAAQHRSMSIHYERLASNQTTGGYRCISDLIDWMASRRVNLCSTADNRPLNIRLTADQHRQLERPHRVVARRGKCSKLRGSCKLAIKSSRRC